LTICNIIADGYNVALVPSDFDYQVPQLPAVNADRCVTFTAPFTTRMDFANETITVASFAGATWVFDVREGASTNFFSIAGATFTVP